MFEIIYISPSCKQAMDFIIRLADRLKDCGITNFEIDREHLQLKTDKFIVSAVSINGNLLGVSRRHVKYYIDEATLAEYPCEEARYNAIEKLNCLRCRFREDTREISEEELIEILREGSQGENSNT